MALPATFAELQAGPAYMVYLPRLRERADHSCRRLRDAGFQNIVLAEGVDGAVEDVRALGEQRGIPFDPNMADGEMGCALSMIALWAKVVDEDLPYMLVFEDDVLPHPDIARLGPQYWAETPREADFVLLGNQMDVERLPDRRKRVVVSPTWCLHAYLITQEGARRSLALLREQITDLDRWLRPVDMEVRRWMETGAIRYFCWNGSMLPIPFPVETGRGVGVDSAPKIVASTRTGLFFQNISLGSATWRGRYSEISRRPTPRPKAILITAMPPSGWGNGLSMRAGAALEGLAMACDVTLVLAPLWGDKASTEFIEERVERSFILPADVADPFLRRVERIPRPEERHRARLFYPRPMWAMWSTPAAAASIIDFTGPEVDLIYVLQSYLAPLAEPWAEAGNPPRFILDADTYDPPVMRQLAQLSRLRGDPGGAAVHEADADRLDEAAREWFPRADLVLAASDLEIAAVRAVVGDVSAQVLPNPTPLRGGEGWAEPVDLVFVGSFGYYPNEDAALWLCQEIRPRLRERMNRPVRVALAGAHPSSKVLQLAGDEVTVIRHPPSVTPLYEAATIAVAPLRAGGGTKLKVLEAFAHRRAVVSTSLGAEGLPVLHGRHLLIADTAEDFADSCARALADRALRSRLVSEAVAVAIAHAWPKVANMVAEIATAQGALRRAARPQGLAQL